MKKLNELLDTPITWRASCKSSLWALLIDTVIAVIVIGWLLNWPKKIWGATKKFGSRFIRR